jgi:formiminoglutamase
MIMTDIFSLATRPNPDLFFKSDDPNDVRLGEIIPKVKYDEAEIVIIGCPQDEGLRRNNRRIGAAFAPDKIREQFYKLTNFGINTKIFDIGNTIIHNTLEETHDVQTEIISLGGGNDISYADGCGMAEVFGDANWIAINIDAHFDVRADEIRSSGTTYRQLLDEGLVKPANFYEIAYQTQANSPVYFEYLQNLGVSLISLEHLRSTEMADTNLRDLLKQQFIHHTTSLKTFFSFGMDAVRSSDAPGTSAPSPIGLRAGEFIQLVKYAGSLTNTQIIEFTEVNPLFDIDDQTTKLVAIAIHRFCAAK